MRSLFDMLQEERYASWAPEAPPCLDGIHEIYLNFETTGLRWFDGDHPIAASLHAKGRSWYLPWEHRGGGNLAEETMKRWALRELRGKHIVNANTRFDVHMARVWGVDLEAQGNTVSDVQHYAALLDDHRQRTNIDLLIRELLKETPMARLDESRMADYHAGEAAPRSMYNVDSVRRLKEVMWPELTAQDLQPIRALEDRVIYVVCEMEKNGSPIDVELLEQFIVESQKRVEGYLWQLAKELGWACNPDSPKDMVRAFLQLKLPIEHTASGRPSFTDAILRAIPHPTVQLMRKALKLASLKSKFIDATKKAMGSDGILRYELHQLRATKDDTADAGEVGTVTGRFSSSKFKSGEGCNIQQRMKAAKQRVSFGYDEDDSRHDDEIFLVRKLHIAGSGQLLSSDMDQAQYRIFAHYVNNPAVIAAYAENPKLKFHDYTHDLVSQYATLTYRQQKDYNFATIFGAGLTKRALMLGHITAAEFASIRATRDYDNPKLAPTKEVQRIYDQIIPEVQDLLARAAHLGKPKCDEQCRRHDRLHRAKVPHQGYVRTFLGRRMRFPDGNRLHKAFNGVDQGTEADLMKTKLVELHEQRHETGFVLRITNHDEVVGDIADAHHAKMVDDILNRQSFALRVPMTWSTEIGHDWATTEPVENAFDGAERVREQQRITDLHRISEDGVRGE